MFFGFSTRPGETAEDGSGSNSPYVSSLVKRIKECNTSIYDIFTEVNNDVQQLTNKRQVPYMGGTLNGRFYFCNTTAASAPVTNPTNTTPPATSTTTPPPASDDAPAAKNLPAPIQKLINDMVYVPGGTFTMGCTAEQGSDCEDDEKPAHRVTVSSFKIGKYEVTQAQWRAVMGTTIRQQRDKADKSFSLYGEGDEYPMYYVSYYDALDFITELNAMTGLKFRLPTEAEWEYAARGGRDSKGFKYSGSASIDKVAVYNSSGTQPVGSKTNGYNELGLYDMTGNVWEWCADWYDKNYYESSPMENPKGPASGLYRVVRGGSWGYYPWVCRVASRDWFTPDSRGHDNGFRLAQD